MSGPNEGGGPNEGDEPIEEQPTEDVQAYSAPESEQFTSAPYVPADPSLYDYDAYSAAAGHDDQQPPPRWPWVVGVAAILAAVALVTSVSIMVTRTSTVTAPTTTTPTSTSTFQDEITTTTPPPPPTTTEPPPPPPPPTQTVTVTPEPPPPPPPPADPPPPPPPAPTTTTPPAAPRQVIYSVTGSKAPGDIISVTFTDASGRTRTQRNVVIPWSMTLTPISNSEIGSVEASSFFRLSRLNCSITSSDGTVLSQQSDNAWITSC